MSARCQYPTIRFVAWEERTQWGRVFVPDPSLRARYILTDRSVALVACPQCKSIPGEPCQGSQGYGSGTHTARRYAARHHRGERVQDFIEPVENFDWEGFQ